MVAACLVVRSERSLAPLRISPVAVLTPREVCFKLPDNFDELVHCPVEGQPHTRSRSPEKGFFNLDIEAAIGQVFKRLAERFDGARLSVRGSLDFCGMLLAFLFRWSHAPDRAALVVRPA